MTQFESHKMSNNRSKLSLHERLKMRKILAAAILNFNVRDS